MFELFTGAKPWDGMNPAEIIYAVTAAQKRPVFPLHVPVAVVQLASDCWHHDAEKRPAFDEICDRITDMLSELTMEHVADLTNGASEQTESTCESIKSLQKQSVTGGQTLERLTKARPSREKSLRKLAEEASPGRDNFTDEDTDDDEDEDNPTVMFDQGGFATRNSEDVPTNL
mmetsp:Transcript_14543/g.37317  ORF Transcript_14543/g.37317 Transcript_14543/m.37317 type:complete len:173 (+) Transcript_14543:1017-1535(+)